MDHPTFLREQIEQNQDEIHASGAERLEHFGAIAVDDAVHCCTQREAAIKDFDERLAKLGYQAQDAKAKRSHHKPTPPTRKPGHRHSPAHAAGSTFNVRAVIELISPPEQSRVK